MVKLPLTPVRITIAALLVVCFIVLGHVLLSFYEDHSSGGAVNFQEYTPLTLPLNTSIKSRYINVWIPWSTRFLPRYTKQLDLYLSSTGTSAIIEQKNINFTYTCSLGGVTCVLTETPHHQRYLFTTSYEQTGTKVVPFEQKVEWLKGDTYIWIVIQGSPTQTYSQATWSKVIGSFVPTHYSKLPIKRYYAEP